METEHKVGDEFYLYKDGNRVRVQVTNVTKQEIQYALSLPLVPNVCTSCGHEASISRNVLTGLCTCQSSGCGQEFGYDEPFEIRTVRKSKLSR